MVLQTESNVGKNPAEIWPGNPGRVLAAPQAPRFDPCGWSDNERAVSTPAWTRRVNMPRKAARSGEAHNPTVQPTVQARAADV